MVNFLIIIFIVTLLYMAKTDVIKQYIFILAFQGMILFAVALLELKDIDIPHLILILLETLLFKGIFVPMFLHRLAKRSKLRRNYKGLLSGNASIAMATLIVIISFTIAHAFHDQQLQIKYFTARDIISVTSYAIIIWNTTVSKNCWDTAVQM